MIEKPQTEGPYDAFARTVLPQWRQHTITNSYISESTVTIVDISSTGSVRVCDLTLTKAESASRYKKEYETRLQVERQALRTEAGDIKTRLVLFKAPLGQDGLVLDLYGVEFRIEPAFFIACSVKNFDYRTPFFLEEDPPAYLNFGRGWCAKIVGQDVDHPLIRRGVTVVLICLPLEVNTAAAHASMLPRDIFEDTSFTKPPAIALQGDATELSIARDKVPARLFLPELYCLMITRWNNNERIEANEQPLNFLFPLLELHVNQFQALAAKHYQAFLRERISGDEGSAFELSWRPVRDAMMMANMPFEALDQYHSCHAEQGMQKPHRLQRLLKRFSHVFETVSKMEAHVRDELALQVGHLSLEESKESIKQSKVALEESKRVKMLTILAFVFIPISLATSVFGMDIQELNETGQPFWVFAVTATVILLGALAVWAMFYQWAKFMHAPYREPGDDNRLDNELYADVSRWTRLGLVFWLISHGHLIWCWRSGIVYSLFTGGKKGFSMTCNENICWAMCPRAIELLELKGDTRMNGDDDLKYPTHSPHGPIAYVYAHSKYPSRPTTISVSSGWRTATFDLRYSTHRADGMVHNDCAAYVCENTCRVAGLRCWLSFYVIDMRRFGHTQLASIRENV